jgi:hypothetical protein
MARQAAVGFRVHSGWAAAAAIAGPLEAPEVVWRGRAELTDAGIPSAVQPYHAAAGLAPADAERYIASSTQRAAMSAATALRIIAEQVQKPGCKLSACGLLFASGRPLPALEKILASHAMIHTAEGELFREAVRVAARHYGLRIIAVKESELFPQAAAALLLPQKRIAQHVSNMGRALGPPWRQDERLAAAVAWLALSSIENPENRA